MTTVTTQHTTSKHQEKAHRPAPTAPVDRHRVVVGVDDSDTSAAAVDWAATEAMARGVGLHIVHAWEWQLLEPWSHAVDRMVVSDLTRRSRSIIRRYKTQASRYDGLLVTAESRRGYPSDVLAELDDDAAIIVVGTRHLRTVGRAIMGSVSTGLVARAHCPVVVLAAPSPPAGDDSAAVVVGVTGTEDDARILDFAFRFASRHNRPLRARYFWDPVLSDATVPPPDCAQAWLSESLAGWRQEFPDVHVQAAVVRDHPVHGLVGAARPQDLIVVGRHTKRLRLGAMLGSVSLGVLHHSTSPIAVIPPAKPSAGPVSTSL